VCFAIVAAVVACSGPEVGSPSSEPSITESALTVETEVTFHDVASELGLTFVHEAGPAAGFPMPEIMSGGAAVFDADGDGDGVLDIYLVNAGDQPPEPGTRGGGAPNRLYRQDPETGKFVDVTDEAGVGDRGYGMGAAVVFAETLAVVGEQDDRRVFVEIERS
jgi:hypothetical protein